MIRHLCSCTLAALLAAPLAIAQSPKDEKPKSPEFAKSDTAKSEPAKSAELPADSITDGSVTIGGQPIDFRAIAGTLTVGSSDSQDAMIGLDGKYLPGSDIDLPAKVEDQPATSRMYYVAYFKKDAPKGSRPITFIYNGGPGSSTMYLHMGAFGPVRIVLPNVCLLYTSQSRRHQKYAPPARRHLRRRLVERGHRRQGSPQARHPRRRRR